ncbi:hypothetical protein B7463_g12245, partial [Scytalidium lignicola]
MLGLEANNAMGVLALALLRLWRGLSDAPMDNFPLALAAHSAAELPLIPSWVQPPVPHIKEKTPLFIGFTRNWRLLQQTVVSYITSGWPVEDIYVVENTGVMYSNRDGLLMDLVALSYEDRYADSHPDLKPQPSYSDFSSIYTHCVNELRNVTHPSSNSKWGLRFFSYDRLALINVKAFMDVGGWDTLIPFYLTDCDMHERLTMNGWNKFEREAGLVFDVGSSLDDLIVLYRKQGTVEASFTDPNAVEDQLRKEAEEKAKQDKKTGDMKTKRLENSTPEAIRESDPPKEFLPPSSLPTNDASISSNWKDDTIGSPLFRGILNVCDHMQNSKAASRLGRNSWQVRQTGGKGEPFYRDSEGFETGILMTIEHGRAVFREKWGHRDCDLITSGLGPDDAWKVKHDWD